MSATTFSAAKQRNVIRALIQRDGLRCCFCGCPMDPDAKPNTNGRISIEHVVPKADGGTNARTNLKLAHRGCNSRAGRKAAGR